MALLANPEKIRLQEDFIVRSNTESDDKIKLRRLTIHKDTSYDPHRSKRIYADIVAVPYRLPRRRIHQEEYTYPPAKGYFPSENIERHAQVQKQRFRRELTKAEEKKLRGRYSSGHYSPSFTRISDQPILGEPGDKLYFHYLALSNNSYLGQDEQHNRYYRVPYESCFCIIHGERTLMLNGYTQVEPYWNEDYQKIEVDGKIIRGKLKGNLVIGIKEAPEYRTGVVRRPPLPYGNDTRGTIKQGDIVIYSAGSEFKNTIEGKEVYVMPMWNIIAKRESDTIIPVGDYVHMRVRPKKGILLSLQDALEQDGEVIATGETCTAVKAGEKVLFNTKGDFFNIGDTILLREGHIMARYGDRV